jgi:D-3-phosphoglycerate dehydrogenase
MTHHVLVPDNVNQKAIDLLNGAEGITVDAPGKIPRDELLAVVANTNALVIRSGVKADAELLNAATNLKVIARAGVGVDNVDLAVATERGVVVMNTPGGNTIATAEHTFGLMLALARQVPHAHQSMMEGRWDRKAYMGAELRGKTLGVVGFGRIGRAVAARALAFEMTVVAHDPFVKAEDAAALGVQLVSMDELYAAADFITLHTLITDETRGMINAETIGKMKDGVRIVNAARGALINEAELAEGLDSGKVAGAALDVYASEPPAEDNPLLKRPNVVHTPHLAASTHEAQVTVAVEAAELVINALTKGVYDNVTNPDVLK